MNTESKNKNTGTAILEYRDGNVLLLDEMMSYRGNLVVQQLSVGTVVHFYCHLNQRPHFHVIKDPRGGSFMSRGLI